VERAGTLWKAALALAIGAAAAWLVVRVLPASGSDVERARALGIVSISILAGHSKSAESLAYFLGMAAALAASLACWRALAGRVALAPRPLAKPVGWLELALVALLFFAIFGRTWRLGAATLGPWPLLSEEGEMLAWVDTVLRGGALSRDVFCLYGPLSTWVVALLFQLFGASITLWRGWIFAAGAAGLVASFLLLRGLLRSRIGALAGALCVAVLCSSAIPAMSWSPSRVGLGLGALAALSRAYGAEPRRWLLATGALLAATLLYSQEVGVTCGVGAAAALALRPDRVRAFGWSAVGAAALLVPAVGYIAAQGALGATLDNLFLFPRIRVLGFGGLPFPAFAWSTESLRAYFVPAVLGVSGFATAVRLLGGDRGARTSTELALFLFGLLLFSAALSRPDTTHFAFVAAPALVLLAGLVEDAVVLAAARVAPLGDRALAAAGIALAITAVAPYWGIAGANLVSLTAPTPPSFRAIQLPRAGGALAPDDIAGDLEHLVAAIRGRTAPDEPIWVFPNEALLYFLAERPQATSYPLALFAVTRAQREDLVAQLERVRPRYAVVYRQAAVVDGITYDVALPEVVSYLASRYEGEADFGAFTLLRRKI
jgi:hypothetical protein